MIIMEVADEKLSLGLGGIVVSWWFIQLVTVGGKLVTDTG